MAKKFYTGVDLANQRGVNFADPTSASDAATKQYVDNLVNGLDWKQSVRAATTANIAGALGSAAPNTLDGVSLAANDRVLVKDQTTQSQNGIYVVTTLGTGANGVWTRATDMDAAAEFANATVYVEEGTVNADKAFVQTTNNPITVGTTAIVFAQTGGGTSYSAGNGLSLASTTFSVLADPVSGGGISVSAAGVKVDTAVVVRKFAANIGNGSSTSLAVTHNLGTTDVTVSIKEVTGSALVEADIVVTDANTVTITFATAPTTNQFRVTVHG